MIFLLAVIHSVTLDPGILLQTEIGKERALAKQSINVLGRHLVILRIDCPRTTAVRITSSRFPLVGDVVQICRSLGDVSASFSRDPNVLDVHFKVSEWPNMVKILNRYKYTASISF